MCEENGLRVMVTSVDAMGRRGQSPRAGPSHQTEARALILHGIVGDPFPEKGLKTLAVVSSKFQKANRELTA
ncbi:MAG: hypothetical protein U0412_02310 [Nitrospira sp.]